MTATPASSVDPNNAGAVPAPKPPARVTVTWAGEHRFDGKRLGDFPAIRLDASGKTGPSPVDALLLAFASCTCVDVVDILEKRRTPAQSLTVDVAGDRVAGVPSRVTAVLLAYNIEGEKVERVHAERAIELAITKYCSVRDSLNPAIRIRWQLTLNGEPGQTLGASESKPVTSHPPRE